MRVVHPGRVPSASESNVEGIELDVLDVLATGAIPTRRRLDQSFEVSIEVTLVREAGFTRDFGNWPPQPQERLGSRDAELGLKGMRRHAKLIGEYAAEMEGTQARNASKICQ